MKGKTRKLIYRNSVTGDVIIFDHSPYFKERLTLSPKLPEVSGEELVRFFEKLRISLGYKGREEFAMEPMQNMRKGIIEYPEDILLMLREEEDVFLRELKMLAAVKFYESKRLSLGKAAELAGLDKMDFIKLLSRHRISVFSISREELLKDIEHA